MDYSIVTIQHRLAFACHEKWVQKGYSQTTDYGGPDGERAGSSGFIFDGVRTFLSRVFRIHMATEKSPEPAGWEACATLLLETL
jgi:hypothetical protein